MKVKDIIKELSGLDPERELLAAWWYPEDFDRKDNDEWKSLIQFVDKNMDWSYIQEDLESALDMFS